MSEHHQHQQQQHHNLNTSSEQPTGRKESNCVRCRNHGLRVTLKGHKTYCPYASCSCDKCSFTAEQQRQMRLQGAIRRQEMQNGTPAKRRKNSTNQDFDNFTVSPHQQSSANRTSQPPSQQQQRIIMTTVARNDISAASSEDRDNKMLFDCSSELVKKLNLSWEHMPIIYALSKYANGNIDEILRKIDEGQTVVNEQLRQQTVNMFFAGAGNQSNNQPTITFVATRECG